MPGTLTDVKLAVVDRHDTWREFAVAALAAADAEARGFDDYSQLRDWDAAAHRDLDLVIFGCARIGQDEIEIIDRILSDRHPLLVLCLSLPWGVMRSLFLSGVNDVVEKTFDPDRLVEIVLEAIRNTTPRDSYEAVEYRGVL
jgi:DNA-binding NtrC family response regulator